MPINGLLYVVGLYNLTDSMIWWQNCRPLALSRVQLALDPLRESPSQSWKRLPERFAQHGITIVSGMFGCEGEDYTSLKSIRLTGGIAPDATWERNLEEHSIHRGAVLRSWDLNSSRFTRVSCLTTRKIRISIRCFAASTKWRTSSSA